MFEIDALLIAVGHAYHLLRTMLRLRETPTENNAR